MNRRGFLSLLGLAAGGILLEEAIPLGRVWSFPSEIVIAPRVRNQLLTVDMITREALEILKKNLVFGRSFTDSRQRIYEGFAA